uniref:Uncharacterized protein n=1 Tax=Panagrolaimus sp. PS1159 TaxID=55785 RepID=A0AC35FID5_9BILA
MFVPLIFSILSLCCFLTGIILAVFELSDVLPSVLATSFGLIGLFISAGLWLTSPKIFKPSHSTAETTKRRHRRPVHCIISKNLNKSSSQIHLAESSMLITPHTTEALIKSIRGIPYLIQAIQYSLETNYYTDVMNELGQTILGNSVIHTAPGCTSVLDCDSDDEHHLMIGPLQTPSPRLSGPEEQWEATTKNRWSNPQLRLSLNRRTSALLCNVFPYSESRPVESFDESINENFEENENNVSGRPSIVESDATIPIIKHFRPTLGGSQQSQLSRVTVSHTSLPSHEVRCIGMSGALLTKFNSSFKSNSTE